MNKEMANHYYHISFPLDQAIEKAISEDKKILLFCNRIGSLANIICRDCNKLIPCPQCQGHLISNSSTIKCRDCAWQSEHLNNCPN